MNSKPIRAVCLFLVLLTVLLVFPACEQEDLATEQAIQSITVDKKRTVTATVHLYLRTVQEAATKKAYLYELLPGDLSIEGKTPIDEAKLGQTVKFKFSLLDGERSRLYSSFVVALEDGTLLTSPHWIDNPEILASNKSEFLWERSAKGLNVENVPHAFESGSMHVMLTESFSDLLGAEGKLSANATARLDAHVIEASKSGMQVSLTVIPNRILPHTTVAKIFSDLAARYNGGENGCISAFFILMRDTYDNAALCRLASLALRSRVANGRIYMISDGKTAEDVLTSFTDLQSKLKTGGTLKWGAAAVLASSLLPWETDPDGLLAPSDLKDLSDKLIGSSGMVQAEWFALCDLSFDTLSSDEQAVSFAYAYREAVLANAGLIFYRDQVGTNGLYRKDGTKNRIASVFASIDSALSPADLRLCKALAGEAWDKQTNVHSNVQTVIGTAALGASQAPQKQTLTFEDETLGFFGVSTIGQPELRPSAALGKNVLFTWIDPGEVAASGIRRVFENANQLKGISELSIRLLAQVPSGTNCRVFLTLDGETEIGTRLRYTGEVDLNGPTWQTATYSIAAFTADADLSRPVAMTLTVAPTDQESADDPFVLWVSQISMHRPAPDRGIFVPIAVILISGGVVFLALIAVYRFSNRSARRKHR